MKKGFVTGINGFAGSHLAEHLVDAGYQVSGLVKPGSSTENLRRIEAEVDLYRADLRQPEELEKIFSNLNPDQVYHLAGLSSPRKSIRSPRETMEVNALGQMNLLEILSELKSSPRVLVVGSAAEYGLESTGAPCQEQDGLAPVTPYAVSKVTQDFMGFQYFCSHSLPVVRVRPFNHTGPRRPSNYVLSSFARQLVLVEAERQPPVVETGDLGVKRDFTDVRDTVRAYKMVLEAGRPGEVYNVCSGDSHRLADLLEILVEQVDFDVEVTRDESRERDRDAAVMVGNNSKLRRDTGWSPRIAIRDTLGDLMDHWRSELA